MDLLLIRDYAGADGTLGTLQAGTLAVQTLELPWEPAPPPSLCGRPDVSCVPAGTYRLALHDSPAHPRTFALVNPALGVFHAIQDVTPGLKGCRTEVLLHSANYTSELEGCIAVGLTRQGSHPPAIWQSRAALTELMSAVPWVEGNTLTIQYGAGLAP